MTSPSALYNQLILEHNKKPRNHGKVADATHHSEGLNPLCGDHIWLTAKLDADTIEDIRFEGQSCAICQASASIMTTQVKGKSLENAQQLVQDFRRVVTGQLDAITAQNADNRYLQAFAGIANLPARVKCAVLPWHTLQSALTGIESSSTEGAQDPVPGSSQVSPDRPAR